MGCACRRRIRGWRCEEAVRLVPASRVVEHWGGAGVSGASAAGPVAGGHGLQGIVMVAQEVNV